MPYLAGEPTTKITIRLFAKDIEYLKRLEPDGYQVLVREIVRTWVKKVKMQEFTAPGGTELSKSELEPDD